MKLTAKVISGVVLTAVTGVAIVGAHDMGKANANDVARKFTADERSQVVKYIDEGNFAAWQKLMTDNGMTKVVEKVTAAQFAKMTELEKAMKAGDMEKVKQLRTELKDLGLPGFPRFFKHKFVGEMKDMAKNHPKMAGKMREMGKKMRAMHKHMVDETPEDNGLDQ